MNQTGEKLDIVIVGGGTAGWIVAAVLARGCQGRPTNITLVESDEIGIVGVGEATIPPIQALNQYLDIDVREFLQKTNGTFKLGIEFRDWVRPGHRYFHQFGPLGMPLQDGVPFHNFWLKLRGLGDQTPLEDYMPNAVAARQGRFILGPKDQPPPLQHAYHFDASMYGQYLRAYAEKRGVKRVEGKVTQVQQNPENGFVTKLTLDGGRELAGDFFVDCSGFRGLLIEGALRTGYDEWGHWLPCDRAVAMPSSGTETWEPYTKSSARPAGWHWRIPLQHRVGNGYVYSSRHISDDEAVADLRASLPDEPLAEPRFLRFTAGRRKKAWNKNVVAIGLASGFLEPLESTSIHFIQTAAFRLLTMLPLKDFDPTTEIEFNRLSRVEAEHSRDFIIAHYYCGERTDTAFWSQVREMEIPDTLRFKLDLFKNRGRVAQFNDQMIFLEPSWVAILLGQNVMPGQYDPLADTLPVSEIKRVLGDIRGVVQQRVGAMPTHRDFVTKFVA
jgi:tryptophan halogenase